MASNLEDLEKNFTSEWEKGEESMKQTSVSFEPEDRKDKFRSRQVLKEWVENGKKVEAVQPATLEREEEFKKRYESWDDLEVFEFHYGSHHPSAGIAPSYLLRLPPFSAENQKSQGGQCDHADRLFNHG